ncbi:MAG: enoyl-CoA hydratase/isomerase family protein [Candidatus Obscuribacterales bacterium]|nr:enoyl-CoA hydratase/isomerase family protein [Candidatus Obscuribacterales bacterium]
MLNGLSLEAINLSVDNGVLSVTLNRPESINALSTEMVAELTAVFQRIGQEFHKKEGTPRLVIMRGAGGNFCGGGDAEEMARLAECSRRGELVAIAAHNSLAGRLFSVVSECPVPVVAAVEGIALGGGLGLSCAADVTVATADAQFGLPETSLGLIPAQVAPYILRRVGQSRAKLLAITGRRFDAASAERMGLVHYLAADRKAMDATISGISADMLKCAPGALASAKQLMCQSFEPGVDDSDRLAVLFAKQMASGEGLEGTRAFSETRSPAWVIHRAAPVAKF